MSEVKQVNSVVNSPVGKEKTDIPKYKPSNEEIAVLGDVYTKFRNTEQARNQKFAYFDYRDLTTYIDDCVVRFVTNIDERDDIEDWQARVNQPFSRNKVLAILGKIVDALPQIEVTNRGGEDYIRAEILNTLFEYSEYEDDSEEFFIYFIEECLVKGTAVGYEGIDVDDGTVRDIVKFENEDNLTIKENTIKKRKLSSTIVPLEEFYPSSVGIRKIKDMPFAFWRKEIPFTKFQKDYGSYKKAKYVEPYSTHQGSGEVELPFYKDYISSFTIEGNVEILRYYNQVDDQYIIVANGIWLNPIKGEVDMISPLPFTHKKLPFFSIIYDILGSDFFYGKSLVDRLKALQDVLNVLNNMLLDQSFLSVFSPILMAGDDEIEDDFLRPGRRIQIDTGGLPLNQSFMKLDMGTPGNWHQFILDYTKRILEESSIDSVQQGAAGVGGRTTATEIRSAAAGVVTLLGLFAKFIKFGMKDRARLRVSNILQFYTDPEYPILEGVLGVGSSETAKEAFNVFRVNSSALTAGKRGEKIIMMFQDKNKMPTSQQLKFETSLEEKLSGHKISKIAVIPEYIRNIEWDVVLVPGNRSEQSKDLDRALEIQFQQTMNAIYPDLVDREEMAAQLVEKYGRDPRKVLKQSIFQPPQAQPISGNNSLQVNSGGDNSANTVRGSTGVGQESLQIRDLTNQMTG